MTTIVGAVMALKSKLVAILFEDPHHELLGDLMPLDSVTPHLSATYKCVSCHMITNNMTIGSVVFVPGDDCLSCHINGPPSQ